MENTRSIKLSVPVITLFIWGSALAGPLKFASKALGFPAYLLPKGLLLAAMLGPFVFLRANLRQYLTASAILLTCLVALKHHLGPAQIGFGLWALLPLLYGLLYPDIVLSDAVRRGILAIFIVSVVGEIMSYVWVFPWAGMSMEVGGVTTQAAREWSSGSARRLAGFATSSHDLSFILAIFGIFFVFRAKYILSRIAILVSVAALIVATTMKTAVLAFVLACLPLIAPSAFLRVFSGLCGLASMAVGILVPFLLYSPKLSGVLNFVRHTSALVTLEERFDLSWPAVLAYFRYYDMGIWGIGMGSLGSANGLGDRMFAYASTDNLYLYIIGTAGIVGALLLLIFAKRICVFALFKNSQGNLHFKLPLLVFFAIDGFTQSFLEVSVSALFFGAVLFAGQQSARLPRRAGVRVLDPFRIYPEDYQPGAYTIQPGVSDGTDPLNASGAHSRFPAEGW